MKKLWNILNTFGMPILVLFLLAFIPLYPKLPLVDIKNTWVYIRLEDFFVLFGIVLWLGLLLRKQISIKMPVTYPILLFWIVGALATIHGILIFFPDLANVYPNVAFLSFLRRIEYVSLFFVAFASVKDKKFLPVVFIGCLVTLILVCLYGLGQKYFGLYAYLTMNEEYAKGLPIQLSLLSRVSSTFGGHYDLAAYLTFILPILISVFFGITKKVLRLILLVSILLGIFVLFLTVSRISFFAVVIATLFVLFLQKRNLLFIVVPVIAVLVISLAAYTPQLFDRFSSTIKEADVLVDARSGKALGHLKIVPNTYFENKIIRQQFSKTIESVDASASPSSVLIVPFNTLPPTVALLEESNVPTGENLPQGSGYINLSLSPVSQRLWTFYYERKKPDSQNVPQVFVINGDYLLKKALAYDLSFTTRFQGEWPHAFEAFKRNILFGSGYGSVSLAVDNSYLRMLAETGLLGIFSFGSVFVTVFILLRKAYNQMEGRFEKSFLIGYAGGFIGLAINAIFIDVFEASKVAFVLWLITGIVVGVIQQHYTKSFDVKKEFKSFISSPLVVALILALLAVVLYSRMMPNYFVGDDFTWFRWVADCQVSKINSQLCHFAPSTILHYFQNSDGFFYRPGAKTYFSIMYSLFWLNPTVYHSVSIALHYAVSVLVYLLARKLFRNTVLSFLTSCIFLMLSGVSEAIFWISATGFLFASVFLLLGMLLYGKGKEENKYVYLFFAFFCSFIAPLFHELGVVSPLFWILYDRTFLSNKNYNDKKISIRTFGIFIPIVLYFILRIMAHSLWLGGDYSYSVAKLPLNSIGNALGYFMISIAGPVAFSIYNIMRTVLRAHLLLGFAGGILLSIVVFVIARHLMRTIIDQDKKILIFSFMFYFIALIPFLGLGNITSRYSYLASIGVVIVIVLCLKKVYEQLLNNGKVIAISLMSVGFSVFIMFHIIELQQVHSDWFEAGQITEGFLTSLDSSYDDYWSTSRMEYHFVNIPIKHGDAWVFPVGITDALWLQFHNSNIAVYSHQSITQAYDATVFGSKNQKIFEFDSSGGLVEKFKPFIIQ